MISITNCNLNDASRHNQIEGEATKLHPEQRISAINYAIHQQTAQVISRAGPERTTRNRNYDKTDSKNPKNLPIKLTSTKYKASIASNAT